MNSRLPLRPDQIGIDFGDDQILITDRETLLQHDECVGLIQATYGVPDDEQGEVITQAVADLLTAFDVTDANSTLVLMLHVGAVLHRGLLGLSPDPINPDSPPCWIALRVGDDGELHAEVTPATVAPRSAIPTDVAHSALPTPRPTETIH